MATALEHVQANGAPALALRDVARHLGVSLPAVQNHFPTKQSLWEACVQEAVANVLAGLTEAGFGPQGPSEPEPDVAGATPKRSSTGCPGRQPRLELVLRAQLQRLTAGPGLTAAMAGGADMAASEQMSYLAKVAAPAVEKATELLAQGIRRGNVRAVEPGVVLALLSLGIGSLLSSRDGLRAIFGIDLDDARQVAKFVDDITDVLLRGLLPCRAKQCTAVALKPTLGSNPEGFGP